MSLKNVDVNSVSVTPEMVARLGHGLEGRGMSAKYIRALAVEANSRSMEATDTKDASDNGVSKEQPNVLPFMSRCSNRPDSKEPASVAEVAVSLAIYQALGNSIDNFDWKFMVDSKESGLDAHEPMAEEIDQFNLAATQLVDK